MPFGLQPLHLIVILVVALLIFGPSRLPEIGRAMGKTIREFQSATKEATQGLTQELSEKPVASPAAPVASPAAPATTTVAEAKQEEPQVACKNCGKSIQVDMKFCPNCGAAQ